MISKLTLVKNRNRKFPLLKRQSSDLKEQSSKQKNKIDSLEQYGRRQNTEVVVVLITNENTSDIVVEVANLVGVKFLPKHISTSHRMSTKAKDKNGDRISPPPPIIVRFTNRDIHNKTHASRRLTCSLNLKKFSVPNTSHAPIYKNLTRIRKRLF